jgi:hypothetical protein
VTPCATDANGKPLYHYVVESEAVAGYSNGYEPPEPWLLVDLVLAPNRASAKALTLQAKGAWSDPLDVRRYRRETAGSNPFRGLKAHRGLCDHGLCQFCDSSWDEAGAPNCFSCRERYAADIDGLVAEAGS